MHVTIYVPVVPSPGGVSFVFVPRASATPFTTTDSGPVRMDFSCVPHNQAEFRVAGCSASTLFNCFKRFNYFKMTITLGSSGGCLNLLRNDSSRRDIQYKVSGVTSGSPHLQIQSADPPCYWSYCPCVEVFKCM
ncbi:hypothetical protein TNCV_3442291 [Trichonephila clavipes]|nr:hypothetical protein TNCV_3442291 [Trichonephila clavipes]